MAAFYGSAAPLATPFPLIHGGGWQVFRHEWRSGGAYEPGLGGNWLTAQSQPVFEAT